MALIFSSGGGRLGNQILNLIHLMAFSCEYGIDVLKMNDSFLISRERSFFYKVEKNKINWQLNKHYQERNFFYKLFLKFFIRFIHFYFYISPNKKSYKIGVKSNYPNFVFGKNLGINFSKENLIKQSQKYNVVLSGWGLRDWELVLKHKESIVKNIISCVSDFVEFKNLIKKDYLLVHIRRLDFLEVDEFEPLNFNDEIWLKSILKLSYLKGVNKVAIFSDSSLKNSFISTLEMNGLKVIFPEIGISSEKFLDIFLSYIWGASFILCNASTLVLSFAFLNHEKIYLPSRKKDFQEIFLNKAHNSFPTLLNWN